MSKTFEQHTAYSKDLILFAKENWYAFDAFKKKAEFIKPFEYQIEVLKKLHEQPFSIVAKTRQMHVSSMMSLYIAWYALFNTNKNIIILSNNLSQSSCILERIRWILQTYSVDDEKDGFVKNTYFHWENDFIKNNKKEITLKNGCRIIAISPLIPLKGYSIDLLYIDEAAFIKNFMSLYMCLAPCVSLKDSKIIIASSPKENSTFNDIYLKNKESSIFLHWIMHPEYSKDSTQTENGKVTSPWYEDACRMFGHNKKMIKEELDCVVENTDSIQQVKIKNKTITVRLSETTLNQIQELHGVTSDYIRKLIEDDMKKYYK